MGPLMRRASDGFGYFHQFVVGELRDGDPLAVEVRRIVAVR